MFASGTGRIAIAWIALAVLLRAAVTQAEPALDLPPASAPAAADLTVGILDFQSDSAGNPNLGAEIADVVDANLSARAGIELVNRQTLSKLLAEHEISLTGQSDPKNALQIGKLIGARLLITGRAFALEDQVLIIAHIIGTETGLESTVIVQGPRGGNTAPLLLDLAKQVGDRIATRGNKLVAQDEPVDPLAALKAKLARLKRPAVWVHITEQMAEHAPIIDPAVETEMKKVLIDSGISVIDCPEDQLEQHGVELVVRGEATSAFNARIGNLVSCSARAEIKVVERKTQKQLVADRSTARAVDLSEEIAGKTALQKAGRELGNRLLEHLVKTLPEAKAGG